METKQKEQLKIFEQLGIDIFNNSYYSCVDILIERYLTACDALEYNEEEKFRKEIERIKKPTN